MGSSVGGGSSSAEASSTSVGTTGGTTGGTAGGTTSSTTGGTTGSAGTSAGNGTTGGRTGFLLAASADFNGDGLLDLVRTGFPAYPGSVSLSIFFGEAGGGLGAPVSYPGVADGWALAVGDIDGDGRPDLAVSNGASVSILLNDGTGHLNLRGSYATSFSVPVAGIAIGDVNGDGLQDLFVAQEFGEEKEASVRFAELFLGNGPGTFAAPIELPEICGDFLGGVAMGDLNHDGLDDIVAQACVGGWLAVLLSESDGGFTTDLYPTGPHGQVILTADDARVPPDIVFGPSNKGAGNELQLLRNAGQGKFSIGPVYFVPGGVMLTTGDFNGDGIPDVATTTTMGCGNFHWGISVIHGDGDGGFVDPQSLTYLGSAPGGLAPLGPVESPGALAIVDECLDEITVYGDGGKL